MAEAPHARHNRVAPEIVRQIVENSDGVGDAFTLLESVCLGVILVYLGKGRPRDAGEMLDALTAAVITRIPDA